MIGIKFCVVLFIFHVVLSEQIPPHCTGPPPEVKNPKDCCKSENIFSEEDFKECGIEILEEDAKRRQIPECSKLKCVLNRYSLMKDENTVDKEAVAAFLDAYVEKNAGFKDVVESTKQVCLKDDLLGPPEVCEATKIVFCTSGIIFMNCPTWEDTDNCKKLKNHLEYCNKYFF